jgi:mono/diheme cytochrome c family protein
MPWTGPIRFCRITALENSLPDVVRMKTALKIVGSLVLVLVLAAGGGFAWANMRVSGLRERTIETHAIDFPIPFPLDSAEMAALTTPDSADEVALANAIERGRHSTSTFYVCGECHGQNFGGGTMIDDPAIGRILGPNLTRGSGSVVLDYAPADWDRAVRHGVGKNGLPTFMPAVDFQKMSDRELSDIVAFLGSLPPVDNEVLPVDPGPLGTILVALGQIQFSADLIPHRIAHLDVPPATAVTTEFGSHLAGVCVGCHGTNLAGGPIQGGDPAWPPARNLTPHEDGLAAWTYDDFVRLMRDGKRPDGTDILMPMATMMNFAANMSETELQALWEYLRTVPPVASAN